MIEYKQPAIVEEIRRRIRCGIYTGQLPTTAELAEEFGVNIKTMSKAVSQLVDAFLPRVFWDLPSSPPSMPLPEAIKALSLSLLPSH